MTNQEYIWGAIRTESPNLTVQNRRLTHGIMGCSTEAGEMMDNLKRAMFYGNDLDIPNLKEEIGDMFWYLALLCNELGVSFEHMMERNIAKLKARYPDKFSKDDSDHRDYNNEASAADNI